MLWILLLKYKYINTPTFEYFIYLELLPTKSHTYRTLKHLGFYKITSVKSALFRYTYSV